MVIVDCLVCVSSAYFCVILLKSECIKFFKAFVSTRLNFGSCIIGNIVHIYDQIFYMATVSE